MLRLNFNRFALLPATVAVLLAAGCSGDGAPKESQVAVNVNDGEISAHQVQAALRRQASGGAALTETTAADVLEVLVDQELAAQAAAAAGMDKNPDVIQALELQRREVLARAYHDRIVDKVAGPSSDDVDRYYASNPALFGQRRLYLLQETAVEVGDERIAAFDDAVAKVRDPEELAAALDRLRLGFTTRQYAQAAEDVPFMLLPAFSKAGTGDSIVVREAGGARIFSILHLHEAPVDRLTAAPAIARYLVMERQRRLVGEAMAELRKGAKLQYSTAFARKDVAASAPVSTAVQPEAK